jgi:hypothetical protein
MDLLRAFYDTIQGRFPHLTTPVRLLEEDTAEPVVLDAEAAAPEPLAAAAD